MPERDAQDTRYGEGLVGPPPIEAENGSAAEKLARIQLPPPPRPRGSRWFHGMPRGICSPLHGPPVSGGLGESQTGPQKLGRDQGVSLLDGRDKLAGSTLGHSSPAGVNPQRGTGVRLDPSHSIRETLIPVAAVRTLRSNSSRTVHTTGPPADRSPPALSSRHALPTRLLIVLLRSLDHNFARGLRRSEVSWPIGSSFS